MMEEMNKLTVRIKIIVVLEKSDLTLQSRLVGLRGADKFFYV